MGVYLRNDFSAGWVPSADSFNGPPNGLLRMDNLTLDELGIVSLRQGSAKINTTALSHTETTLLPSFDHTVIYEETLGATGARAQFTQSWESAYISGPGPASYNYDWEVTAGFATGSSVSTVADTDCHSLFTGSINGSRYRMTGATNAVFANGTSIATGVNGSEDISFGSHLGHILFARGTTKKKFDGTTVRNWGIAASTVAPIVTAIDPDSKVFASCASTELPVMTTNEGSQSFVNDRNAVANAAVQLTPDATTGRAVSTKTFTAPTDFSVYTSGQTATDSDLIDFYAYYFEPQLVEFITLQIDVNDGTFSQDWYEYSFSSTDVVDLSSDLSPSARISITSNSNTNLGSIQAVMQANQVATQETATAKDIRWNHFNILRGNMARHGGSTGRDWSTVKAVRIIAQCTTGGAAAAVIFDDIQILGGVARPLTGTYGAIVVAVRNDGNYEALSGPSPASANVILKGQGLNVQLTPEFIAALDSQVNELWVYVSGGHLDNFYRAAVATAPFTATGTPFDYTSPFESTTFTSVSGHGGYTQLFEAAYANLSVSGGPASYNYAWEETLLYTSILSFPYTVPVTSSEVDMLETDLVLETDNLVPPDNIIGIEGPHYDRTMCLTAQYIYPSREIDPDAFSAGEVVRVGDPTETALWIAKLNERLYVGTTRDIYFMDGDWAPLPDGGINVVKRPLGVTNPPVSKAFARGKINGSDQLIYLSAAGWCTLGGELLTNNAIDLLWRGETRHGVPAVNITSASARFRAAISKNILFALTPEYPNTTSSAVIHAYHFTKQKWYRFGYPQAFRSLYTEPDGSLIAGDSSGFIRQLDISTKTDDGALIGIDLRLKNDDNGQPFNSKDAQNFTVRLDTGLLAATIAYHLDGNAIPGTISTTVTQGTASLPTIADVTALTGFYQQQLRVTGSFSTFAFRGYQMGYLDSPQPLLVHDTGFVDLSAGDLVWLRRLWVKATSPVNLIVTPYFDGTAGPSRNLIVGAYANKATVFPVPLGREDKGRSVRIVITSPQPSQVYYVQFEFNASGKQRQKIFTFKPDVAA